MTENSNNIESKGRSPVYMKWQFWVILILIGFIVWCLLTKGSGDDTYTNADTDTYTVTEFSQEEKQTNAAGYEEEYPIGYWEDTGGEALCSLVEEMLDEIELTDYAVSFEGEDYQIYKSANDIYSVYIEADKVTDEVHYIKTEILDWEAAQYSVGIFCDVIELLGEDYIYQDDFTYDDFLEEAENVAGAAEENAAGGYDSIILLDGTVMEIFENDSGYPSCEMMAVGL